MTCINVAYSKVCMKSDLIINDICQVNVFYNSYLDCPNVFIINHNLPILLSSLPILYLVISHKVNMLQTSHIKEIN